MILGLIIGLISGLIYWLISGINGVEIENKTFPNQGIKQSIINTIIFSAVTSLPAALMLFIFEISLSSKHEINSQVLILISSTTALLRKSKPKKLIIS